jgi:hypothetical protein
MPTIENRKQTGWLELAAVGVTGIFHLVSSALGLHGVFVLAAALLWMAHIGRTMWKRPARLQTWGFRTENLGRTFLATTALCAPVAGAMAAYAAVHGAIAIRPHAVFPLLLYPLWGLVQQFLVQGLVIGNLVNSGLVTRRIVLVLIGASLFGLVHVPSWPLVLATFGLGLLFVPVYLRFRNLWPLGIYHGWLGTLFYYWILGRDPWLELFTSGA